MKATIETLLDFFYRVIWGFIVQILPQWVIQYFFLKWIISSINEYYNPNIVFYFCLILFSVTTFLWQKKVVEPNKCLGYQNRLTGSVNPKWPGFNWIGILEHLPKGETFNIDTQKHNTTSQTGTWDAVDDTLSGKWTVLWRPAIENIRTRNANIRKYIKATVSNISSALAVVANDLVSMACLDAGSASAAKQERTTMLAPEDFEEETKTYGLEILTAKLEDLDYSETTQQANEAVRKMRQIPAMVKELMTYHAVNNPFPVTNRNEAYKIAKAQLLGGNYKQIETGANVMVTP